MENFKEKLKVMSKRVGLDILVLVDELPNKPSGWIIAKQIVASGTSVGANYRAACVAKSKADFIYKLKIVEEEADETMFWLELIEESQLIESHKIVKVRKNLREFISLIVTSLTTLRK